MNEQLHAIEAELRMYEKELHLAATEYCQFAKNAATFRSDYDLAKATKMIEIVAEDAASGKKRTDAERKEIITVAVKQEMYKARLAESLRDATKMQIESLQSNLTSVQTRAKLFQTEASLLYTKT